MFSDVMAMLPENEPMPSKGPSGPTLCDLAKNSSKSVPASTSSCRTVVYSGTTRSSTSTKEMYFPRTRSRPALRAAETPFGSSSTTVMGKLSERAYERSRDSDESVDPSSTKMSSKFCAF